MSAYAKPPVGLDSDRYINDWTQITLQNGEKATLVPINDVSHAPEKLIDTVHQLLNDEIIAGDTYPQDTVLTREQFVAYYFGYYTAVLIKGGYNPYDTTLNSDESPAVVDVVTTSSLDDSAAFVTAKDFFEKLDPDFDFSQKFLGSYYVKPNYPGRASHNCNGGFLVSKIARGNGIGKILGMNYLVQAPKLGFRASIFNLVFVTNVASYKIWDNLGFKRIGLVPKAAYLKDKGYTDAYVYYYDFMEGKE